MTNKNITINVIKGIAILLVVYGHLIQHGMAAGGQDFFSNPVYRAIYAFHMPLFIFISGYLTAHSLKRKTALELLKAKVRGLLIPCIVWGILGVITLGGLLFIDGKAGDLGIFWNHLTHDLSDNHMIWFIWFLFTLFMCTMLLLGSIKLAKHLGVMAFVGVYVAVLVFPYNGFLFFYYVKWLYVFFLAGYFVNASNVAMPPKGLQLLVALISAILFVVLLMFWTSNDFIYMNKMERGSWSWVDDVVRLIYRDGLSFLGIIVSCYVAQYLSATRVQGLLSLAGVYSLDIYLIQRYIVEGLVPRVIHQMHHSIDLNVPVFLYGVAPILSVLAVWLCILISQQFIRKNEILNTFLLGHRT